MTLFKGDRNEKSTVVRGYDSGTFSNMVCYERNGGNHPHAAEVTRAIFFFGTRQSAAQVNCWTPAAATPDGTARAEVSAEETTPV
jgi:hypothetical protein